MDFFVRIRITLFEIKRLLLIISSLVVAVVVFQGFLLPYGKILSLSPGVETPIVVSIANATTVKDSQLSQIFKAVTNYREAKETDVVYGSPLNLENHLDHESNNENVQEIPFNQSVTFSKSLILGLIAGTDNSSTQIRLGELQEEKLESNYEMDDDKEPTAGLTLGAMDQYGEVENLDANSITNVSSIGDAKKTLKMQHEDSEVSNVLPVDMNNNSTTVSFSVLKRSDKKTISVSQMNKMLFRSRSSSHSVKPRWSSLRDHELVSAKLEIQNAPVLRNSLGLHKSVYRNLSTFIRSYELMERTVKVYVYKEGKKPIFHQPYTRGIYASEGWFMKLMERNKKFVVKDPRKAHLFYLPFSSRRLRHTIFEQIFQSHKDLQKHLNSYVDLIARKYKFWNRTGGSDHFFVACHDWAPKFTRERMKNCIKSLCNSNIAHDFRIGVDTALPVTYIRSAAHPVEEVGGKPPSQRSTLAFFAGSMHGYLRPVLLQYWEKKEADMKIFGPMPRDVEGKKMYREYMKSSKYCICARGYEVHTPRVVEAIFYECVPVIISDNYVPPFFEVLNWEAFAVFVEEKDIPNLRNILLSIPEERYLAMQLGVKSVQKHFLWHIKPAKYDLFHMILHSIWYNRVLNLKAR